VGFAEKSLNPYFERVTRLFLSGRVPGFSRISVKTLALEVCIAQASFFKSALAQDSYSSKSRISKPPNSFMGSIQNPKSKIQNPKLADFFSKP
jgi:hypothetical protein